MDFEKSQFVPEFTILLDLEIFKTYGTLHQYRIRNYQLT